MRLLGLKKPRIFLQPKIFAPGSTNIPRLIDVPPFGKKQTMTAPLVNYCNDVELPSVYNAGDPLGWNRDKPFSK